MFYGCAVTTERGQPGLGSAGWGEALDGIVFKLQERQHSSKRPFACCDFVAVVAIAFYLAAAISSGLLFLANLVAPHTV